LIVSYVILVMMLDEIGGRKSPAATYLVGPILLTLVGFLAYSAGKNSAAYTAAPSRFPVQLHLQSQAEQAPSLQKAESRSQQKEDDIAPLPFYVPPAASVLRKTANCLEPVTDKVGASWLPAEPNDKHTYDALYR